MRVRSFKFEKNVRANVVHRRSGPEMNRPYKAEKIGVTMKLRVEYLYIALFLLVASPSLAQATRAPLVPGQPGGTRVQVSVSFFIDDDAKDADKSAKLAEETRKILKSPEVSFESAF